MSEFDTAVEYVLSREQGLNENPKDRGGITNYGISLRFLRELSSEKLRRYGVFEPVTEQTIRDLTPEQAKFIYKGEFWENQNFAAITSQELCNYYFDMAIALGLSQATKLIQRATWAVTFIQNYVKDDGIFGSKTLAAINAIGEALLPPLIASRAEFYRLVAEIHFKDREFLNGWLSRAYHV